MMNERPAFQSPDQKQASLPPRSMLQLPVVSEIKALNTAISGINNLFPEGYSLSFDRPVTLLYSEMGSGKTGFMKMLHDSICFNNYFEINGRAWFVEEMLRDHELGPLLKKKSSISKSALRSFLYSHQNDYAFRKYLDSVKPGLGNNFSLKKGISPEQFNRLYQKLSEDCEINRFFYFSFKTFAGSNELFSLMQEAVSPERYARKIKNEDRQSGVFNRLYDALIPLTGQQSGVEKPYEHEIIRVTGLESDRLYKPQTLSDIPVTPEPAVNYKSAGQGVLASWLLTKARIRAVLDEQSLLLPEVQIAKKNIFQEQSARERIIFSRDAKLVVFLDDPDAFMDPLSVRSLCKDVLDLVQVYQGRIHFFICSHNETMANLFDGKANYINCYNRPAKISDKYCLPDVT